MKLMASGDHHFDEHSRFDECVRVHRWIADEVALRKPDVFLSGGDIYERASTPVERAAVADWLGAVAETCPVLIAKGNHDRPWDCALLGRLRTKHPVIVEEGARVHRIGDAAIAAVAWPNKASVAAMVGGPIATEALDDVTKQALRNVLSGLGAELAAHDGPRVLLMHAMASGAVTSLGQPMIGGELALGLEDLGLARPALTVLSHIHMPQEWAWNGAPVVYCGSPIRTAFGECEEKSVLVAEFDGARLVGWERVATPARPMLLVEGEYVAEERAVSDEWGVGVDRAGLHTGPVGDVAGAEIRLRYRVELDQRDAAKIAAAELRAQWIERGAVAVKVEEEVVATTRARAPEVAKAVTIPEKLHAFWESRGVELDGTREARVLSRLAEIEAGYGSAA
jgi:DNA repair exonuclease SbcCD nuclease subunit